MARLLLSTRSLDDWRRLGRTSHQARLQRLLAQADSYRDWLPPAEHPRDSITYIGMAAANLSLAYLLDQDPAHLAALRRWLSVALGYPHWGRERMPDHDLDAGWLLCGLGLAYDWAGDALPPDERAALRHKLLLQGRRLYDFAVQRQGGWWSSAFWQNHNWICYAGLLSAAYALREDQHETRAWAERALANFRRVLTLLADDGSDYEGPVYWCYGLPWLLLACDLLRQHAGADLHNAPFLRNTFAYRLYVSAPNLVDTANFGDCHDRRSAHAAAIYYRLASLYRDGYAQWLAQHFEHTGEWEREGREGLLKPGLLPQAWLEFLWYDPGVEPLSIENLPLARHFPDLGLVSARSSWQADATFLAFKCGRPSGHKAWAIGHALNQRYGWQTLKASHAHPDENSFILVRGSDYLVVDEGYSKAKLTRHHSSVLVDGHGQYREGTYNAFDGTDASWGGRIERYFAAPGLAYSRGEAAAAYDPALGLRRFNRQVLLLGDRLVLICDDLEALEARSFSWLLQTDVTAQQLGQGRYLVQAGSSSMQLAVMQPAPVTALQHQQEISANPSSAIPDWILRHTQHTLELRPPHPVFACRFLVLLCLEQPAAPQVPVEAAGAQHGQGLVVQLSDQRAMVAVAGDARGVQLAEGLTSDGRWAAVLQQSAGQPRTLAAGEATQLWLADQLYCAADTPVDAALYADTWHLHSSVPTMVTLWTPVKKPAVLLNGAPTAAYYDPALACVRLALPAGETRVQLRREAHA